MKRSLLIMMVISFFGINADNNEEEMVVPQENVTMSEQQYWQDFFSALQEFKQNATVKTSGFIQEATNLEPLMTSALINAALIQVISHALFVREQRTSQKFSTDFRKALAHISQDDELKKELSRLVTMNLDPLWFLGKKTTVEQMSGITGQDLVRAAALNQIVLKYAERVRKMIDHQRMELAEKKVDALKPLIDTRLLNFKMLEEYVAAVIKESKKAFDSIVQQAQQKINNQAVLQYIQNMGKYIYYVPDQAYVEEMEIIGNVAQALYPSAAYKKYMGKGK